MVSKKKIKKLGKKKLVKEKEKKTESEGLTNQNLSKDILKKEFNNNKLNTLENADFVSENKIKTLNLENLKIIIFILGFLLLIFSFLFFYFTQSLNQVFVMDVSVEVGDYIGFNLDKEKLYFGTVFPGSYGERTIIIETNSLKTQNLYYELRITGNIKDNMCWMNLPEQPLKSDEKHFFKVCSSFSKNAKKGVYEGTLYIYLFNKKPNLIHKLFMKGSELKEFDISKIVPNVMIEIV